MKICVNCDSPYMEPIGYCDSDRCAREVAEYERFCLFNGDHCFDCFLDAISNGVPLKLAMAQELYHGDPQALAEIPWCPTCHSNAQVLPITEGSKTIGWMCKVCAWTSI
jgi:hypothetical protein